MERIQLERSQREAEREGGLEAGAARAEETAVRCPAEIEIELQREPVRRKKRLQEPVALGRIYEQLAAYGLGFEAGVGAEGVRGGIPLRLSAEASLQARGLQPAAAGLSEEYDWRRRVRARPEEAERNVPGSGGVRIELQFHRRQHTEHNPRAQACGDLQREA